MQAMQILFHKYILIVDGIIVSTYKNIEDYYDDFSKNLICEVTEILKNTNIE